MFVCNVDGENCNLLNEIENGKPFRITQENVWDFLDSWNIEQLREAFKNSNMDVLAPCKNGSEPLFVLHNPLQPFPSYDTPSYELENITSDQFFERMSKKEDNRYLYYSGSVNRLPDEYKDRLLNVFDRYYLDTFNLSKEYQNVFEYKSYGMIWMGNAGVTANCHYDRSHNIFIQLHGRKKWTLFPPTDWKSLYLYPSIHPSYHQTQVPVNVIFSLAAGLCIFLFQFTSNAPIMSTIMFLFGFFFYGPQTVSRLKSLNYIHLHCFLVFRNACY